MRPFPTLETERLVMNQLRAGDIPRITEYAADENIARYTLNIPHPYAEQDAVYWLHMAHEGYKKGSQRAFAIRLKPELAFIGGIGLIINRRFQRAELGYWVAKPYWNRGFTSEAAAAVIEHGFQELDLNKIYATHLHENPASGKVMERNGMQREGYLKEHVLKNGVFCDLVQYGLTREQFRMGNRLVKQP
jgi:RimJ/RimL family protein N-acetyltransferase